MLRILIADDHELLRMSLREMLELRPGWTVCGEAASGLDAVRQAEALRPDVAILDLRMPELGGLEAARRMRAAAPSPEILILTGFESEHLAAEVASAGARGLAYKGGDAVEVMRAVEALEQHRSFLPEGGPGDGAGVAAGGAALRSTPPLTPRELEIAQLLAEGKTNWCVGTILGISVKTVETHRANILRKLGLESVVELVHYAVRNHLIML